MLFLGRINAYIFLFFRKKLSLRVPLHTVQVLVLGPLYAHSKISGGVVGKVFLNTILASSSDDNRGGFFMSNLSIHMFYQSIRCLKIKRTELTDNITSKVYNFFFDTLMA